jgi:hypothetical protein
MASLMPGKSSPSRLIMGTTPDVDTVMRRFDIYARAHPYRGDGTGQHLGRPQGMLRLG